MSTIAGIKIPDSTMARDLTGLIRDTETDLLFHHSTGVYLFGVDRAGLPAPLRDPGSLVETV